MCQIPAKPQSKISTSIESINVGPASRAMSSINCVTGGKRMPKSLKMVSYLGMTKTQIRDTKPIIAMTITGG